MSTILSSYSISGGNTTSSTFTYSGSTRELTIEITGTSLNGGNAFVQVQSGDGTTWQTIQYIPLKIGTAYDVYELSEAVGNKIRCLLFTNDCTSGTVSITASEPSGGGDLLAANNLSDVADTSTSNHNLGNSHGTYTPTFTPDAGTSGTAAVVYASLYSQLDTEAISGSFTVQLMLDAAESVGVWYFNLPIVPTNNFTDAYQLQVNVGYPINQALNTAWVFKATAEVGTKTGRISFTSDTVGDAVLLSIWYSYHNN